VQVSGGATATISGNTISGNLCDSTTCGPNAESDSYSAGIILFDTGNVTVANNSIANNDTGIDVEGNSSAASISITGNSLVANRYQGIVVASGPVTVNENEITGTSNIGVLVNAFSAGCADGGSSASASVTNNRIADAKYGIRIVDPNTSDGCVASASGNNNSFAGTTTGVDNQTGTAVDFRSNWWGNASGPTSADNPGGSGVAKSANVLFSPWLREGTDTSTARGFQPTMARAGIATRLAFITQPGGGQPGQPLSPQPIVQAQDADGNPGVNFNGAVTLTLGSNPTGASLGGMASANVAGGTATFANVSVDRAGNGYTLVASANGLANATSGSFTVATPVTPTPVTPTPTPSPIPTPSTPASVAYTVSASASGPGAISPTGTSTYGVSTQAAYTATATGNAVFVGWTLDGVYVGYASPLNFVVNNNRTLVATFVARTSFSDVPTTDADYQAITFLTALGIINPNGVNGSGQFQPDRAVNRAEISAFIARLFGLEGEFHANTFPDRCLPSDPNNCIDARLWNDVAALKDYGVVGGYTDSNTCTAAGTTAPCYLPRDSVKRVQVLSIIARSFIKTPDLHPTSFWDRLAVNSAQYTNVGTEGTQRSDLTTYRTNAGPIPGQTSDATFPSPEGDGSRRFVIEALFQAFAAQFSVDRVP